MTTDERFMRRALVLAARGGSATHPNPNVGAVVVKGGRIVGEGYHRVVGGPHAEVVAQRRAGRRARGATLYVTLEPCAHVGRTPPCTEAIAASGVRRVVAAMTDPNPRTRGRGVSRLRADGTRVSVGLLADEARRLNEVFVTAMTRRRPFVTAKIAQSLDGKIATRTGASRWISSPQARRFAHRLRASADAICVGVRTVLLDDPLLSNRLASRNGGGTTHGRQPIKVILDSRLRTPLTAQIFSPQSPAPVIVATTVRASTALAARLRAHGATVLVQPARWGRRQVRWRWLCEVLFRRGIQHLLIEGGGEVLASALAEGVVDRGYWIIAPMVVGGRSAPTSVGGEGVTDLARARRWDRWRIMRLGSDLLVQLDVQRHR